MAMTSSDCDEQQRHARVTDLFHGSENFIQHLEPKHKEQKRCAKLCVLFGYLH